MPAPHPSMAALPFRSESLSLQDDIAGWMALAELHFAEAEAQLNNGNLDTAIEQTRFEETKLATARVKMIEAREIEAMERGS